ncbi:MAG: hypothetical protein N2449_06270 [Bacteroidales bacterium]|nr:hypothetical protein [Bacteroidales bacterium]
MKLVLIVGLPYFAKKIQVKLKQNDKRNVYLCLNTYYNFFHKILYLLFLPFSTAIYSVNGTIEKSKSITLALFFKKKIVMHWVGTDVLLAKIAYSKQNHKPSYINNIFHITDTPWFEDSLKEIGIDAKFLPLYVAENKMLENIEFPDKFNVLVYIPQHKQEFYGIKRLQYIASLLPNINFYVAGVEKSIVSLPPNVILLGWVTDMSKVILNSVVCMRIPEHDGLSFFVLEALQHQRYVLYNQPLPHTFYVNDDNEIIEKLKELINLHSEKKLSLNKDGREWVINVFSEKNIDHLKYLLTNE